jgi:hypothetical protein
LILLNFRNTSLKYVYLLNLFSVCTSNLHALTPDVKCKDDFFFSFEGRRRNVQIKESLALLGIHINESDSDCDVFSTYFRDSS